MTQVAAIQMTSLADAAANLREAERLIEAAAGAGAALAVLPENFAFMGRDERDKLALAEDDGAGPIQDFLAAQAVRHGIWLVGGTLPLRGSDKTRVWPACMVWDAAGRRVARYDKIHLFDVHIGDSGETYRESDTLLAGDRLVVVRDTPVGNLGLAICYDLRFPELFRALAEAGASVVVLPAAFTATTGRAHWETLVRARAIENLCYMVASAQSGRHARGRETWGHSMVVDPWGSVLDCLPQGAGMARAEIDLARLESVRTQFPALGHRRQWRSTE